MIFEIIVEDEYKESDYEETRQMMESILVSLIDLQGEQLLWLMIIKMLKETRSFL